MRHEIGICREKWILGGAAVLGYGRVIWLGICEEPQDTAKSLGETGDG